MIWQVGLVAGDSSSAVGFYTQVVCVHLHTEETVFAPISTPRVSADPVFLTFVGDAVANDRDSVVKLWALQILGVNSTEVSCVKLGSSLNTALDGTMLGELSLHLAGPHYTVVFTHVVVLESDRATVLKVLLSWCWCRANTVSADIKIGAESTLKVKCLIVHAAAVRNTLAVGILVHHCGVTTVARSTGLAVDYCLSREVKRSCEVKSV